MSRLRCPWATVAPRISTQASRCIVASAVRDCGSRLCGCPVMPRLSMCVWHCEAADVAELTHCAKSWTCSVVRCNRAAMRQQQRAIMFLIQPGKAILKALICPSRFAPQNCGRRHQCDPATSCLGMVEFLVLLGKTVGTHLICTWRATRQGLSRVVRDEQPLCNFLEWLEDLSSCGGVVWWF